MKLLLATLAIFFVVTDVYASMYKILWYGGQWDYNYYRAESISINNGFLLFTDIDTGKSMILSGNIRVEKIQ